MKDERAQLRRELREKRRALPPAQRIAAAQSLAHQLQSLPIAPTKGYVGGYWAVDGEIALHAWQLQLPAELAYCLPLLADDGLLAFAPWRPGDPLSSNRFGIPEPDVPPGSLLSADDMAMVVVPLVGFDARCERLGMGGGWYDRSFGASRSAGGDRLNEQCRPLLVGAAFAVQQVDALAVQPWDIPLDAVCTEQQTFYRIPPLDESA